MQFAWWTEQSQVREIIETRLCLSLMRIAVSVRHEMRQSHHFNTAKNCVFFLSFLLKISILAEEIEALKKEKGETDEARRIAEEQIEAMIKDNEEKVISPSVFTFGLSQSYVFQTLNIGS